MEHKDNELRKKLQDDFDGFEYTPSEDVWNKLETDLASNRKPRLFWILFVPITALLLGGIVLTGIKSEQNGLPYATSTTALSDYNELKSDANHTNEAQVHVRKSVSKSNQQTTQTKSQTETTNKEGITNQIFPEQKKPDSKTQKENRKIYRNYNKLNTKYVVTKNYLGLSSDKTKKSDKGNESNPTKYEPKAKTGLSFGYLQPKDTIAQPIPAVRLIANIGLDGPNKINPVDTLDEKNIAQRKGDSLIQSKSISNTTQHTIKERFTIAIFGSVRYHFKTMQLQAEQLADQYMVLNQNEINPQRAGYEAGLQVLYMFNQHLDISLNTGFGYMQDNINMQVTRPTKNFNVLAANERNMSLKPIDEKINRNIHTRYTSVATQLGVAYYFNPKRSIYINALGGMDILVLGSRKTTDNAQTVNEEIFNSTAVFNWQVGMGFRQKLNPNLFLRLEPHLKFYSNGYFDQNTLVSAVPYGPGVRLVLSRK